MDGPAADGASLSVDDGVATLTLGDGRKRNAIRFATWSALPRLVDIAERDGSAEVIVLRGAGGVFGAGNDIAELAGLRGDPDAAYTYGRVMADAIRSVEAASKPVLMAIKGQCYGASAALALAGDIRVAADDATFAITPAKLGATYLLSDLQRLVAAVGQGRAKHLLYSARTITAAEAREIGLVDVVVATGDFDAELKALIDTIRSGSPTTLRRTKAILRTLTLPPPETPESLAVFVEATQSDDFSEGVNAFLAGRPPVFR